MNWSEKIKAPYEVAFKLAPSKGVRVRLDISVARLVRDCTFESAVYIVFRNNAPQYVGQSGSVSKRFIAGVDKREKGYVWPEAGGDFTVYFFEVPPQDHFRKAIEMEVMLLLRLHTGFWPIESSGAHPFHQLKSSSEINMASTRAREMLDALFQRQPKFAASSEEGSGLLAAFDGAEAILGRR